MVSWRNSFLYSRRKIALACYGFTGLRKGRNAKLKCFNPVAVAAHRGSSKYYSENTMATFRSAVALEPDIR